MSFLRLGIAISLVNGLLMAQAPDLSGTWRLNVEKSVWGKHPKPSGATVTIEHHEPAFKYSGKVVMGLGSETADQRSFHFDGAVDGKEYPVTGSAGEGKLTVRRIDQHTIASELRSQDGKVLETAKTTVTRDGKQLVREVKAAGPNGDISWTEIYDRH
jgi:hypothetical protein